MFGRETILNKTPEAGGCTNTVDLYNPFPDGGGVALYQLNGDATDESGNYDGTASNVTYGTGQFGQAGVFNGSSSAITLPDSVELPLIGSKEFTVSGWFNATTTSTRQGIMSLFQDVYIWVEVNASGVLGASVANSVGSQTSPLGTTQLSPNTWYNFAFTAKSGEVKLYLNGILEASLGTWNGTYFANSNISPNIGRITSDFFNGSIDQVRIFNRALRPYEVEALYTEEYCTPTIVPSEHFNTVLYTGTGATNPVTGVGFQPDMVWAKSRSTANWHMLCDSVRGLSPLFPNATDTEGGPVLVSYDSDGFTTTSNGTINGNGNNIVSWNFKAGGAAVSNTDGTITSQVSANTEAGFSIVSYLGNYTANQSVGHGLNKTPDVLIVKPRGQVSSWPVWHKDLTSTDYTLELETTDAEASVPSRFGALPTSSVFKIGSSGFTNALAPNNEMIAYCFAEVEGFSSFGSYVGNGSTTNVVTGFEPAFLIVKETSTAGSWFMIDNKRGVDKRLLANVSDAEGVISGITFLENGFGISGGLNSSSTTFIYMAFAADPTAVEPSLEDSFNTVTYSGNGSAPAGPILNYGFQPDLVWIKQRNAVRTHRLSDSLRGGNTTLFSDTTAAENIATTEVRVNFDYTSTSARVETASAGWNASGGTYVAWAWKGAEIPAINSNGSIPSVVSANPAAGFSIVNCTVTSNLSTAGHGLPTKPDVVIIKPRNVTSDWNVYHKDLGADQYLQLNNSNGAGTISGIWDLIDDTVIGGFYGTWNFIAYCFAEVAGFSKFGSYTGNGSNQYINLGFEPAFIMVKRTDNTGTWGMFDNKRGLAAPQPRLLANDSASENTGTTYWASTDSTGFTVQGSSIYGSGNFIYMAFANQF